MSHCHLLFLLICLYLTAPFSVYIYQGSAQALLNSPSSTISVDISKLHPSEIAIVQYDSRVPLTNYWLASALWNKQYCDKHGHTFIYYITPFKTAKEQQFCEIGVLASPWCKVKAMVQANLDFPAVKLFLYMDSDAVIDLRFADQSLNNILSLMQEKLNWNPNKKPVVFNQDGPCWWCSLIKRIGYTMCLNAGTVVWYKNDLSLKILQAWWEAANDPYEGNPIKRRFRLKWPWEQDRQMALFNRSSDVIQVASQPDKPMMDMKRGFKDWCLSHLPEAGCFVSHFCANSHSKQVMMTKYSTHYSQLNGNTYNSSHIPFNTNILK